VQNCNKEVFSTRVNNEELGFETPACQDMSLGAEELNRVESSELQLQNNGKKEIRLYKEDLKCDLK
jgi:hypothetical protein